MKNKTLLEIKLSCNYKYEIYNMRTMLKVDEITVHEKLTADDKREMKKSYNFPSKILLVSHESGSVTIDIEKILEYKDESCLETIDDRNK